LQWIEKNPVENISKPSENTGRVRFLSDDERVRLLDACRPHADLYLAVVLALTTGARQAEIMTLRFGQVDFGRQVITLTKTKNGETRSIPLVGEAFTLLQERSKVRELKDGRLFPPVKEKGDTRSLRTAWEMALKKAEITDFHWHDLRHTAASYLAMSGVSLIEIAKCWGTGLCKWSPVIRTWLMSTLSALARSWRLGWGWRDVHKNNWSIRIHRYRWNRQT
jgi:integrase